MANTNINQLPVAIGLDGTEYAPVVQGTGDSAVTLRAQVALIANYAGTLPASAQTANKFFGGPSSGGAALPVFRVLAPADLPGNGISAFTVGDLLLASSTTAISTLSDVAVGSVLSSGGVGVAPAWDSTIQLGASGTLGSVTMGNASSGLLTIAPVTGALGTVTLSLPAVTDTLVARTTTDTLTNKTLTAPVMTAPVLGTPASGNLANCTAFPLAQLTGAGTGVLTWAATPSSANLAAAVTDETGSGSLVFGTSPQFTTGIGIGTASASSAFATIAAGTTGKAPINLTSGTNLTSAAAGAIEYDGVQLYDTIDTTSGRGAVPVEQYFHLTNNGSNISTIANFFGATSNVSLVASAYYEIDIVLWYVVNSGTQTVTWTLTNSAAPASQNIYYEMSPVTGAVSPPGTATMLIGQVLNNTTAAYTFSTAALSSGIHYARFKIWLRNGTGTSLKIQATSSANTITPGIGSVWKCRRISPNNIGTFAA
jgi:hypothetical protein